MDDICVHIKDHLESSLVSQILGLNCLECQMFFWGFFSLKKSIPKNLLRKDIISKLEKNLDVSTGTIDGTTKAIAQHVGAGLVSRLQHIAYLDVPDRKLGSMV